MKFSYKRVAIRAEHEHDWPHEIAPLLRRAYFDLGNLLEELIFEAVLPNRCRYIESGQSRALLA